MDADGRRGRIGQGRGRVIGDRDRIGAACAGAAGQFDDVRAFARLRHRDAQAALRAQLAAVNRRHGRPDRGHGQTQQQLACIFQIGAGVVRRPRRDRDQEFRVALGDFGGNFAGSGRTVVQQAGDSNRDLFDLAAHLGLCVLHLGHPVTERGDIRMSTVDFDDRFSRRIRAFATRHWGFSGLCANNFRHVFVGRARPAPVAGRRVKTAENRTDLRLRAGDLVLDLVPWPGGSIAAKTVSPGRAGHGRAGRSALAG